MEQTNVSSVENKSSKFDSFSREDFIKRQQLLEDENLRLVRENYELRQTHLTDEQLKLISAEQLKALNQALYGANSERYKKPENKKKSELPPKPRYEIR